MRAARAEGSLPRQTTSVARQVSEPDCFEVKRVGGAGALRRDRHAFGCARLGSQKLSPPAGFGQKFAHLGVPALVEFQKGAIGQNHAEVFRVAADAALGLTVTFRVDQFSADGSFGRSLRRFLLGGEGER